MATLAGNNPITANGVYTIATYPDKWHFMAVAGTFGGATVKLEYVSDIDNANYELDSTNTTWTAAGQGQFVAISDNMQLNVTGAGTTNISVDYGVI